MRTLAAIFTAALCATPGAAAPAQAGDKRADEPMDVRIGLGAPLPGSSIYSYRYTSLDLDECEVLDGSADEDEGPGWVHWRCDGLTEDWPVHVYGGDPSYSVSYGKNASEEPARLQSPGHFNKLHSTLEWVLKANMEEDEEPKPVATILRFILQMSHIVRRDGNVPPPGDYPILVITQLKPGAVCHVAYVDARANANANREARLAAERLAGSFDCGAEPELVGSRTPGLFAERPAARIKDTAIVPGKSGPGI